MIMKIYAVSLLAVLGLGGCTIVSEADQIKEATAKCEAMGSTYGGMKLDSQIYAGLSHTCANGARVAVTNVLL